MSLEALKSSLPEYARDIRLNLGSLATDPGLTDEQRAGTFIASALASRNPVVTEMVLADFAPVLTPEALAAAKAAAAVMAMNNVYYRFTHLVGGDYPSMPARLRMNVMAKPGVDKAMLELWSMAVSAVNGCGICMESHERAVRQHGLGAEQVQTAVRIAAVVHAAAAVLEGEEAATHRMAA
jgi:alkyl hydroperoxide reductase subunit D